MSFTINNMEVLLCKNMKKLIFTLWDYLLFLRLYGSCTVKLQLREGQHVSFCIFTNVVAEIHSLVCRGALAELLYMYDFTTVPFLL